MDKIDLDKLLSSSFKSLKGKNPKPHKVKDTSSKKRRETSDDSDDPFVIPKNYKPKETPEETPQDIKSMIFKNEKARAAYLEYMQELQRKKEIEEYERKTGRKIIQEKPKDEYTPKTFSALAYCPGFEEQRKRTLQQKINPIKFDASNDAWDEPKKQDPYKGYTKPTYTPDVGTTNYDGYEEKKYSAVYEYWKDPNYVPPAASAAKRPGLRPGPSNKFSKK